ncbi:MAG: phosphate acyltransferase PlsX [Pseudomonadota bacterium]
MPREIVIALDVMGGDHGPPIVLEGAEIASGRVPAVRYVLFGDEARMKAELARWPRLAERARIVHTTDMVLGTDKPSQALRRARGSSMGLAIQAVKDGEASAAVSAGNTGALMAMSRFILRTMPGIDRPALVSALPTARGESVLLDLGANVDSSVENLIQFAVMGAAFARTVLGLDRPRVALLNIGVEELKGTERIKEAGQILKGTSLPMDFSGYAEGDKIATGDYDVIVSDGFTGNVALKAVEGTAKLIAHLMREAFTSSPWAKIGYFFARHGLRSLQDHLDPNNHNGAVFLGLNGLVVKSHGSASAVGIATAIGTAIDLAADGIGERIAEDLKNFEGHAALAQNAVAE